tara:strand:- start:332 stop:601 length:270 start_codon:yes stop_codon:yes gene_type:complete
LKVHNNLDLLDAKIKLNDYLKNAPKRYMCEGIFKDKNGKETNIDALVMAHTADMAKQKFVAAFTKDDGIAICNTCVRQPGWIEKQGGII